MAKSTAPTTAIKSQLEIMTGKVKVVAPQSALARFIFGDLKGGEHKHNYAMTVIRAAIEQAYKGNTRDIPEAVALCTGKSAKAKAYQAGFHAIADIVAPVKYTGKLSDADNASVRDTIASATAHAACEFELAYLATAQNIKVEAAFNRKAKAKTVSVVEAVAPVVAPVSDTAEVEAMVDLASTVDAVVRAIDAGLLDAREMDLLRASLALRAHAEANAQPALLAA